ncbi:M14 family zinc carboxypeptidase [Halobacteriovorax sp. JY17]|uniref:M14 family zinc carboxypeptidase n=1 Tax=Halobacteriovorax sp. JY17 TaxID=2014617 RepID=UPI000C58C3C7|nr:M14 family zinc carboxypeptidase [Halobacteriovorax sp. JY17]PIK16377.1 MAG: hypothetical protein CES88_06440 [Halobacteriovorax sp. JY17]
MKKIILLSLLVSAISVQANSRNVVQEGFFVNDGSRELLKKIHQQGIFTVDHPTSKGYEVYGPKGLRSWLTKNSPFSYYSLNLGQKEKALSTYPSPEQIGKKLKDLAKKYPSIFKLFSIGKTEQNRELWVMKISDNVQVDEVEPEFKYVANMHGDEIVGREMMVSLLEEIAHNYTAGDPETSALVNNTEIFIMPSLNPDGAAGRRRGNGNWRDLNRDFPDVDRDAKNNFFEVSIFDNIERDHQKETVAMMKFQSERHFALSANFHGGTEVVNYPWDTKRDDFPYKNLVVDLSKEYARKIPSMRDNREFVDGIVNGYEWYEINGGMQDWSYFWHQDLQVTIELSHSKWPTYDLVQSYYDKNRDSLFDYMKSIHQGFGVKLKEARNFNVVIDKIENEKLRRIESIPVNGKEFYKVLSPGKYRIQIISNGLNKEIEVDINDHSISTNGNFYSI